ncbi:Mitogen-activated protein kinase kinase kinase A [Diplonema papillatum]|nr:Mitogen-activated protein kinase kinase kinase A [Diplonema papillatum]
MAPGDGPPLGLPLREWQGAVLKALLGIAAVWAAVAAAFAIDHGRFGLGRVAVAGLACLSFAALAAWFRHSTRTAQMIRPIAGSGASEQGLDSSSSCGCAEGGPCMNCSLSSWKASGSTQNHSLPRGGGFTSSPTLNEGKEHHLGGTSALATSGFIDISALRRGTQPMEPRVPAGFIGASSCQKKAAPTPDGTPKTVELGNATEPLGLSETVRSGEREKREPVTPVTPGLYRMDSLDRHSTSKSLSNTIAENPLSRIQSSLDDTAPAPPAARQETDKDDGHTYSAKHHASEGVETATYAKKTIAERRRLPAGPAGPAGEPAGDVRLLIQAEDGALTLSPSVVSPDAMAPLRTGDLSDITSPTAGEARHLISPRSDVTPQEATPLTGGGGDGGNTTDPCNLSAQLLRQSSERTERVVQTTFRTALLLLAVEGLAFDFVTHSIHHAWILPLVCIPLTLLTQQPGAPASARGMPPARRPRHRLPRDPLFWFLLALYAGWVAMIAAERSFDVAIRPYDTVRAPAEHRGVANCFVSVLLSVLVPVALSAVVLALKQFVVGAALVMSKNADMERIVVRNVAQGRLDEARAVLENVPEHDKFGSTSEACDMLVTAVLCLKEVVTTGSRAPGPSTVRWGAGAILKPQVCTYTDSPVTMCRVHYLRGKEKGFWRSLLAAAAHASAAAAAPSLNDTRNSHPHSNSESGVSVSPCGGKQPRKHTLTGSPVLAAHRKKADADDAAFVAVDIPPPRDDVAAVEPGADEKRLRRKDRRATRDLTQCADLLNFVTAEGLTYETAGFSINVTDASTPSSQNSAKNDETASRATQGQTIPLEDPPAAGASPRGASAVGQNLKMRQLSLSSSPLSLFIPGPDDSTCAGDMQGDTPDSSFIDSLNPSPSNPTHRGLKAKTGSSGSLLRELQFIPGSPEYECAVNKFAFPASPGGMSSVLSSPRMSPSDPAFRSRKHAPGESIGPGASSPLTSSPTSPAFGCYNPRHSLGNRSSVASPRREHDQRYDDRRRKTLSPILPLSVAPKGVKSKRGTIMSVDFELPHPMTEAHFKSASGYIQNIVDLVKQWDATLVSVSVHHVLATWNTHRPVPQHALQATRCALACANTLHRIPFPYWSVCLASSSLLVGHTMAEGGARATAYGDAVQQAKAMNSLAKLLRCRVLATEEVSELAQNQIDLRPVDVIPAHPIVLGAARKRSVLSASISACTTYSYPGTTTTVHEVLGEKRNNSMYSVAPPLSGPKGSYTRRTSLTEKDGELSKSFDSPTGSPGGAAADPQNRERFVAGFRAFRLHLYQEAIAIFNALPHDDRQVRRLLKLCHSAVPAAQSPSLSSSRRKQQQQEPLVFPNPYLRPVQGMWHDFTLDWATAVQQQQQQQQQQQRASLTAGLPQSGSAGNLFLNPAVAMTRTQCLGTTFGSFAASICLPKPQAPGLSDTHSLRRAIEERRHSSMQRRRSEPRKASLRVQKAAPKRRGLFGRTRSSSSLSGSRSDKGSATPPLPEDGEGSGRGFGGDDGSSETEEDARSYVDQGESEWSEESDESELPVEFADTHGGRWWRSDKILGTGAWGAVRMGMGEDGCLVALKTLKVNKSAIVPSPSSPRARPCAQQQALDDILNEVAILSKLRHDHIVSYLSSSIVKHTIVICMEYMPGGSLQGLLEQFGILPLSSIRRYTKDILKGMHFLHANNVVHYDIKPGNVLLNTDGSCKIADFGTARLEKDKDAGQLNRTYKARVNEIVGTPLYMSPEACSGSAGKPTDVWGLGIVLCQISTGKFPFDISGTGGFNAAAFCRRLAADDVRPSIPSDELVGTEAVAFIKSCLQRDPVERPTVSTLLLHPFLQT